jgi:hypothetical protein
VTCENAEQAHDLLRALNTRLREELYPKITTADGSTKEVFNRTGLSSTERPVQQFGERSLDLVLSETLRDVMKQEAFESITQSLSGISPLSLLLRNGRSVTDN